MKKIKNYFYQPAQIVHYAGALVIMLAVAGLTMRASVQDFSRAASPTFTMSQSGDTLSLIADGNEEGQGLLGSETTITYDSKLVEIKSVDFGTCSFNYCIDLSKVGQLKFFGASANPANGGKALTQKQVFAKIYLSFLSKESVKFDFSKCQVITENNVVEDRTCNGVVAMPGTPVEVAVCGNTKVENGEQCDDGNTKEGDGCSAKCVAEEATAPVCGNNKVETGEQCDDGNGNNGDGCSAQCETEAETVAPLCGNSKVEGAEQCDDGNVTGGDGCSAQCTQEGQSAQPMCGNNKVETGEQCDDGNGNNGDGCSAQCETEAETVIEQSVKSIDLTQCSSCSTTICSSCSTTLNAWAYLENPSETLNITSKANYTNSNPSVMTLVGSTVQGLAPGEGTIKATYTFNGVTKTDTLGITIVPMPTDGGDGDGGGNTGGGDTGGDNGGDSSGGNGDGNDGANQGGGDDLAGGDDDGGTNGNGGEDGSSGGEGGIDEAGGENGNENGGGTGQGATDESVGDVHSAAPETIAAAQAENVFRTQDVVKQASVVIQAPKKQEVVTKLDLCRNQYETVDFESAADEDEDGLSNKTECYAGTRPNLYDTDGDTCSDGAENEIGTNPLNAKDCGQQALETQVSITDPHAGWILRRLEVAGYAPLNTASVTAVVFPAEGKAVKTLTDDLQELVTLTDPQALDSAIAHLTRNDLPAVEAFLTENASTYNYENLAHVVTNLKSQLSALSETPGSIPDALTLSLEQLQVLSKGKVVAGTVNQLSDADLSGKASKKFEITATESLDSNKAYDLVAVATLKDGSTRSSAPVRFGLDASERVKKPQPRSIGNKSISEKPTALSNIWIGNVRADSLKDGVEVEIDQTKPTVLGDSEFGSQVFAVWNSVVLASSVISDSEQGAFSIQAPKDLESDIGHRVTLYAVQADENTGQQARSDSVNVFFRIKPVAIGFSGVLWGLAALAALGFATVLVRRRLTHGAPMVTPEKVAAAYNTGTSPLEQELDAAFKAAGAVTPPAVIEPDPTPVRELTPQETAYYEHVEDQAIEQEMKEEEKTHHA